MTAVHEATASPAGKGDTVVQTVIAAYLIGWALSTVLICVVSKHMGGADDTVPNRFALSAGAAALWPLLILGAVEFSSVAVASSAASHLESLDGSTHLAFTAPVVPLR
jgi:hypothetical protein